MNKKLILIGLCIIALLASILSCNAPATTVSPAPGEGGGSPVSVTVTESPVLPPPAVSVLRVAYIKGDNVWLWTEGAGSIQLTTTGGASAPVLSSDGLVVAFLRNRELWAVNADGSGERQLVSTTFLSTLATGEDIAEVYDHVWIPGSHVITFNTLVVAGIVGYRIPQFDLYSCNADGTTDMIVSLRASGSGGVPYVSPDAMHIALAQPDKVIFLEISGAFINTAFTFTSIMTYSEWAYVPQLLWLPDSSGVRVIIPPSDPLGNPTDVTKVWNLPVSGTATTLDSFITAPAFFSAPILSPEGNKVLYMAESGDSYIIQVREIGGSDNGYLSGPKGDIGIVNWSPDSVHFVYWSPQRSNTFLGSVGEVGSNISDIGPNANVVEWIDDGHLIFIGDSGELRYRFIEGASSLIDSNVTEYDLGRVIY